MRIVSGNDYLAVYKDFENELRNNSDFVTVKDYEDSLTNTECQDKLRFARNIRNYLSHHTDGNNLIKLNKELIDFIKEQKLLIQRMNGVVQDAYCTVAKSRHLIKLAKDNKTVKELIMLMTDKKIEDAFILSELGNLLGKTDIYSLIKMVNDNPRASVKNIDYTKVTVPFVTKQTPMTTLETGYYFVKDTKEKICGDIEIH